MSEIKKRRKKLRVGDSVKIVQGDLLDSRLVNQIGQIIRREEKDHYQVHIPSLNLTHKFPDLELEKQ